MADAVGYTGNNVDLLTSYASSPYLLRPAVLTAENYEDNIIIDDDVVEEFAEWSRQVERNRSRSRSQSEAIPSSEQSPPPPYEAADTPPYTPMEVPDMALPPQLDGPSSSDPLPDEPVPQTSVIVEEEVSWTYELVVENAPYIATVTVLSSALWAAHRMWAGRS